MARRRSSKAGPPSRRAPRYGVAAPHSSRLPLSADKRQLGIALVLRRQPLIVPAVSSRLGRNLPCHEPSRRYHQPSPSILLRRSCVGRTEGPIAPNRNPRPRCGTHPISFATYHRCPCATGILIRRSTRLLLNP